VSVLFSYVTPLCIRAFAVLHYYKVKTAAVDCLTSVAYVYSASVPTESLQIAAHRQQVSILMILFQC